MLDFRVDEEPARMPKIAEPRASASTVDRALDVLLLFSSVRATTLGVSEIAQELGMSKPAVHRVLTSLRSRNLVELDEESRRYSLGLLAVSMGLRYQRGLVAADAAIPALRPLSDECQETTTLSVRSGDRRYYVEQVTPDRPVVMMVQLAVPFPLHAGASSKAILAFLPEAQRERYLTGRLDPVTPQTRTDPRSLRRELEQIRAQGYARSSSERQTGAAAVAAPIRKGGEVVAAMSVCGPEARFDADAHAERLLAAVARITAELDAAA
ncbi:IclR family transcriptional regulator [Dactylosporangium sp. NPDC000244]|uniref:IclR family transcriptional regulator n=1 Tax=Dactylosporangium sp. NPDC000244 TaxID=3154365 RepID=UPI003321FDEE